MAELGFDQIQDLIAFSLREAIRNNAHLALERDYFSGYPDAATWPIMIGGVGVRLFDKAMDALIHRGFIEKKLTDFAFTGKGMLYVESQIKKQDTFLSDNWDKIELDIASDEPNKWVAIQIIPHFNEDIPAANRSVSRQDNAWNEPDYVGEIDHVTEEKVRELIKQVVNDVPKAGLNNLDQSQALARLEAAQKLAEAPVPQWGKVSEILAPMENIAVIGASITIILAALVPLL
ncbi:MAG: hypothetical protein RH946_08280 [Rhodospirillales bacterium]